MIATKNKREAEFIFTKAQQRMCKNAVMSIREHPSETEDVTDVSYEVINRGCPKRRREGSAYCQTCSDNYKS